jgi:hypothetical protein
MKINTNMMIWLTLGFIWCIFMGVTAVSYGFGALYPPLNTIAQPFVCPNGQMSVEGYTSNPMPGTTITQIYWYCVDGKSGAKTKIVDAPIHLYAGAFYGFLMFVVGLLIWYLYNTQIVWVQKIIKIIFAIGIILLILFPMLPLLSFVIPESTPVPDSTATALALTYETLTSKTSSDFNSTNKPLANWNGIPIMPRAIAGQQANNDTYTFKVLVDSGTIESYYSEKLKSLGWDLVDSRWQGMKFSKDKSVLLVIFVPATDMESWVVTLVRIP